MSADGTAIIKRYDKLKQERYNFDERWERMAPYLAPSRVGIITKFYPGDKQTRGVYDSSSMVAAELSAHFISGNVINPGQRWLDYYMQDPEVRDSDEVKEWLEECRDLTLRRLDASLFYAEGPESLIDYVGFGTGNLICEEAPQPVNQVIRGFRGFRFEAVKIGRFVIQEGPNSIVDTMGREFEMTARNIRDRWGPQGGNLPPQVVEAIRTGNLDKPFTVIHFVEPRPIAEQGAGAKGMPWASSWVEKESKEVIWESGYRTFPGAVPRYHRTPGEVYGRGRGDLAFPDTWTLNTAKRMGLEDWSLKIRPPLFMRHDSVLGSLRLVPAGPTSINTHGARIQDVIMPYQTGSHPEVSQIKEEELRKSIREIFFVDALRQLLQFEEKANTRQTREEFVRKLEILFRIMGPVYGRMRWEWLNRIVDITFDIQLNAGAFPPPPPIVQNSDGVVDVNFQNPLERAQKTGDAEALQLSLMDLTPLAGQYPQMLDHINPDKTALGIFALRGFPAKWTNNGDEVAAIRQARAEKEIQENRLDDLEKVAGAAGKAAPLLKAAQTGGEAPTSMGGAQG